MDNSGGSILSYFSDEKEADHLGGSPRSAAMLKLLAMVRLRERSTQARVQKMLAAQAENIAMQEISRRWRNPLLLCLKRISDVVISAVVLFLLAPLFLALSIAIKLTSPGPIFFRWNVIGKGGQPFVGYKFRTMFDGADRLREQLHEKNEMTGVFFKMRKDPRVTPIGRILRRFSLDELPQLWSVLKGDMSLVGPRPTQVFEYEQLTDWQRQRNKVKPGTVSLWIVSGKTTDFDQMIRIDLEYIDRWSFWLDLRILLKAVPYVVFGKNS